MRARTFNEGKITAVDQASSHPRGCIRTIRSESINKKLLRHPAAVSDRKNDANLFSEPVDISVLKNGSNKQPVK